MERVKILIADDEPRMRKLIRDFLTAAGYSVVEAQNGEQAVDLFFNDQNIALVILDVMMPLMDGYEACRTIREYSRVPVVMLTARSAERDELAGFDCGADEYISKPFSPKILVARVEALLRRTSQEQTQILEAEGLTVDKAAHEVIADGEHVTLSFKEFELLCYLMENRGIALSREKILNNVWDYDYFGDARTIDTHIKKLRSKLGRRGGYIRTIWRMGYKFDDKSPLDDVNDEQDEAQDTQP